MTSGRLGFLQVQTQPELFFFLKLKASRFVEIVGVVVVVVVVVLKILVVVVIVVSTVFVNSLKRCMCSTKRCCNSIDVFHIRLLIGLHLHLVRSL